LLDFDNYVFAATMTEMSSKKKIYLDYAASTPMDPVVLRAMKPYFTEKFGNPGSLHSFGQEAIAAVDKSRETIAKVIGAEFREIIFTASATEANNLALRGIIKGVRGERLIARGESNSLPTGYSPLVPRIIISAIEHESVLETARDLERDGVEIIYLPVNKQGIVDLKKLEESLNDQTVLVSVMYANNEIGSIQPIQEIAKIVREFRDRGQGIGTRERNPLAMSPWPCPIFHTDAAQAFRFLDCNVKNLGIDLMTLSAHKIYGPKGAGTLFVRGVRGGQGVARVKNNSLPANYSPLAPLLSGGGQEYGLRSGTENVPAIVGFAKAVELVSNSRELESKRISGLRDYLWLGIKKIYPEAEINGAIDSRFLPNIMNVYFPGHAAQDLLAKFDLNGLAVSSGSACRSRAMESSYVIEALHGRQATSDKRQGNATSSMSHVAVAMSRAKSSIRFSLGRPTTKGEIDAAVKIIKGAILKRERR
jgi:cysteine desulfurase